MGPAKVQTNPPDQFLKKHEKDPKMPQSELAICLFIFSFTLLKFDLYVLISSFIIYAYLFFCLCVLLYDIHFHKYINVTLLVVFNSEQFYWSAKCLS